MTAGVFPQTSAGGLPATSANVNNVYVPNADFDISCVQTGLPSDCTARILPSQINAIVSELVALAEALTPDGTWSCASLTNLATAFQAWQNGTGEGTLQDAIFNAMNLTDCDGGDIGAGAQLATCANVAAQIADAIAALPADVFLDAVGGYDAASNVLTLNMSDGSSVPVDMTALVNDAVATAITPANVAGAMGLKDCDNNDIGAGASVATCGNLADAIDDIVIVSADSGNSVNAGSDGGAYLERTSIIERQSLTGHSDPVRVTPSVSNPNTQIVELDYGSIAATDTAPSWNNTLVVENLNDGEHYRCRKNINWMEEWSGQVTTFFNATLNVKDEFVEFLLPVVHSLQPRSYQVTHGRGNVSAGDAASQLSDNVYSISPGDTPLLSVLIAARSTTESTPDGGSVPGIVYITTHGGRLL